MTLFKTPGRQRGMTMIEVLVSIAIFAFGLLGVAGLMVLGIKSSYSSQQRSSATQLAYDIMDRVRANNVGANAGNYNQPANAVNVAAYTTAVSACVGAAATPTGCSTSQMAQQDLYEWERAVKASLGGTAAGIICLDSSGSAGSYDGTTITHGCDGLGATYSVKIYWLDERGQAQAATPVYQGFVTRFLP